MDVLCGKPSSVPAGRLFNAPGRPGQLTISVAPFSCGLHTSFNEERKSFGFRRRLQYGIDVGVDGRTTEAGGGSRLIEQRNFP